MSHHPWHDGAVEADLVLEPLLKRRSERPGLALDVLYGPFNGAIAVGVAHFGVVDPSAELRSSALGDLLGHVDDRYLLVRFNNNPIILESHCLKIFANLVDCSLFCGTFAFNSIRPNTATHALLHDQYCEA